MKRPSYEEALAKKKEQDKKRKAKKKTQKKGRTISVKGAKLKAWTAFAKYIRQRDPYCITCGNPTTEAGHYKHNTDKANNKLGGNELWYSEQNVHGQDAYCNRWRNGAPNEYALFLEKKYGHGILQELDKKFRTARKYTVEELLAIAEKYTKLLK